MAIEHLATGGPSVHVSSRSEPPLQFFDKPIHLKLRTCLRKFCQRCRSPHFKRTDNFCDRCGEQLELKTVMYPFKIFSDDVRKNFTIGKVYDAIAVKAYYTKVKFLVKNDRNVFCLVDAEHFEEDSGRKAVVR